MNEQNKGSKLFENALAYSDAAGHLNTKIPSKCDPTYTHRRQSAAIYEALAIEHYLKVLYFLQYSREYDERGRKKHDFYTLFTELNRKTRKSLEEHFLSLLTERDMKEIIELEVRDSILIPRDLAGTLKLWANTFIHLRVCPSIPISINLFFFSEIESVLNEQIFMAKPEWKC